MSNHDGLATAAFQSVMTSAPLDTGPAYWLGKLWLEDSQPQKAIEAFYTAVKVDQRNDKAYNGLKLSYAALSKDEKATGNYLKAIELALTAHPEYFATYADLAELPLRPGENQKAFDLAAEAASRSPRTPHSYFPAGKTCDQNGKYEASVRWLQRAIA